MRFSAYLLLFISTAVQALGQEAKRYPDVPFVASPQEMVDRMLALVDLHKGDVLVDLGSGDGRVVITAAQRYGIQSIGVEIDPSLVRESRDNARKAGVSGKVEFIEGDLFDYDLRKATVVALFLLPGVNLRLKPKLLKELPPGARVISRRFDMGSNWPPSKTQQILGEPVYLWVIPERNR